MDNNYKVYVKVDENNNITAVNSSAFLPDTTGYIEIDEGVGDKYHHAQNHYLDKPLTDDYGRFNYRYIDGKVVEIPESEKPPIPLPEPTQEKRIEALEEALLEVVLGG